MIFWGRRFQTIKVCGILHKFAAFSIAVSFFLTSTSTQALDQKSKLEQLFLWKLSEELKLSVKEEKELSHIIQDLNSKRTALSDRVQNHLKLIASQKRTKDTDELALREYRKLLKQQAQLQDEEIDRLHKALGLAKLLQYFVVKNELSSKVKGMLLTTPEKEK